MHVVKRVESLCHMMACAQRSACLLGLRSVHAFLGAADGILQYAAHGMSPFAYTATACQSTFGLFLMLKSFDFASPQHNMQGIMLPEPGSQAWPMSTSRTAREQSKVTSGASGSVRACTWLGAWL